MHRGPCTAKRSCPVASTLAPFLQPSLVWKPSEYVSCLLSQRQAEIQVRGCSFRFGIGLLLQFEFIPEPEDQLPKGFSEHSFAAAHRVLHKYSGTKDHKGHSRSVARPFGSELQNLSSVMDLKDCLLSTYRAKWTSNHYNKAGAVTAFGQMLLGFMLSVGKYHAKKLTGFFAGHSVK